MRFIRGFTLIELMVTIAVFAVIAMMAAPSFGNLVSKKTARYISKRLCFSFRRGTRSSNITTQKYNNQIGLS